MQARKELPEGVRTIGPESDKTGHIEYKYVLKTPTTPHRLARLVTQLKWRLIEGGGCAVYELGVLDAGTLVGLSRVDMQETLDTLGLMLSHLGRGHVRISRVVLLGGAGGGSEISSTTPPHEADTTPSSSTLGFTSFDVGSTAIQPVYPGTSPITIKQLNPPNPEREPEERAALKRNKRDARRVKQRNYGGDIVATGYPRPNMESMESSTFNKARAIRQYEAGAVRQPRNFRPSTGQVPGSTPEETYAPTRRPPNSTKQQAPTRPKVILTESIPSHRPRILSEDENEERFVVEAVVMKRPSSAMTPCKGESSDEGLEGMLARTSNDGSSLDAGPGSDEMFGSVDDEEGWSYLAFDSLPKVRRESSSVVV